VAPEVLPHHGITHGVVADVAGDVHPRRRLLQAAEERGQGVGRSTVLTHDDRSDPLAHYGQGVAVLEDVAVGMAVGVDEAGREHQSGAVHDPIVSPRLYCADFHDAVSLDPDARRPPVGARAVEHGGVDDKGGSGW
jgi:hypothetical protein